MTDERNHTGSGRDGRGTSAAQDVEASEDATRVVASAAAGTGAKDAQVRDGGIPPGTILVHTYRVEEFLARGGMGEIYRATHTELNTEHAIKVIRPELAEQPKIVDMFRREASSLRNVRNEAVIAYDGVFRDENGQLYLVMEFVRGRLLSEVLCERHLSIEELRTLCDRIATGLGAAHEKGIVHRDMSPDNVILPDGQVENAKIIDFGIAKLTDPAEATILGDDFAGKYSYASPEQLGLFGGQVDARSDIYSLGLVMVAAAIGHPLDMGSTPSAVIEARRSVPDLSEVPQELRAELEAMLEPNPDDRPLSLKELGLRVASEAARPDITGHISPSTGEDVRPGDHVAEAASPETGAKAPGKRRSRAKAALTLIVALAVIGGAIGGYLVLTEPGRDGGDSGQTAERDPSEGLGTLTPRRDDEPALPEPPKAGGQTPAVKGGTTSNGSLTTVPPSAPPEPAPPTNRNRAVNLALRDITCGNVGGAFGDGGVLRLIGHLPSEAARQALRARLRSVSGVAVIDDHALVLLPEPNCRVVDSLPTVGLSMAPDQAAGAAELGTPTHAGTQNFRAGELLTLNLVAPNYPTYYYVDYYDNANNVIHLLPSQVARANHVSPRQRLRIGGTERDKIGPPFGLDLVVAVGSSVPLFEGRRPEVEPADAYLASLVQALRSASAREAAFRGEYSYRFVKTTP